MHLRVAQGQASMTGQRYIETANMSREGPSSALTRMHLCSRVGQARELTTASHPNLICYDQIFEASVQCKKTEKDFLGSKIVRFALK